MQHEALETRDLQKDTERERQKRGRETLKSEEDWTQSDNPSEKNSRRAGNRTEMVVGEEEVGNCSANHVCVCGSVGLWQLS